MPLETYRIVPDKSFDYIKTSNPTISINPPCMPCSWLNETTGQIFFCASNAVGANVWVGQMGDTIEPV